MYSASRPADSMQSALVDRRGGAKIATVQEASSGAGYLKTFAQDNRGGNQLCFIGGGVPCCDNIKQAT